MRFRNFVNLNYDPNTLDHDQAKARKRKKLCYKLLMAFLVFVLGVGLGIGLCSFFIHQVPLSGFLKSQAPAVPELAHRGIFQFSRLSLNCYVKTGKNITLFKKISIL